MDKVNPHKLGFTKLRFWSSGEQLPVDRVIARVLADPTEEDLLTLKKHFGTSLILSTWTRLQERNEVAESVIPITDDFLRKITIT